MAVLEHLAPANVFSFFEQLSAIPRGSGNTKAVSDWLVQFAKERGLACRQDEWNNVVIVKEAASGYESAPTVILQGHMDMVCEKAPDCSKDMACEGLDLAVDGDYVYARGTTLGADNGIAVAMALAILDEKELLHPRLEVIFTADEETGMDGAAGLDGSLLKGRMMLNMDSGNEERFTAGCAGGIICRSNVPVVRDNREGIALTVTVKGLRGGHSGSTIHEGRGNANMLLGRILCELAKDEQMRIISVAGGLKDNAVPVMASAVVLVENEEETKRICGKMEQILAHEYCMTDPELSVVVEAGEMAPAMDRVSTDKIVCLLTCAPNGVQAMSADIPGLVQTSLNLGILETKASGVAASFCVRSSVSSQKQMMVERLRVLTEQLGGSVDTAGDYPGWEFRRESPLRELMVRIFKEQRGHEPQIEAIHAGLECGIIADKLPGLDCVSIGPNMFGIHTFREKLSISSVARTWTFVATVLAEMKDMA